MTTRPRLSRRAEEMLAVIENYLASGLTQKAFCKQHDLTLPTFQHWRRKFAQRQRETPTSPGPEFIPLHARQRGLDAQAPAQWVIEFPHGVIVRCSGALDFHLLAQLIHSAGN
jgi:transposase-like protein